MKGKENVINILVEDIDEGVLARMPEWFKILRNEYEKRMFEK